MGTLHSLIDNIGGQKFFYYYLTIGFSKNFHNYKTMMVWRQNSTSAEEELPPEIPVSLP